MPVASVTCPSCSASLKVPDAIPAGQVVKCPRCATRFPRPEPAKPADASLSAFWENAALDNLAAAAPPKPSAEKPAPAAKRPAPAPKSPAPAAAPPANWSWVVPTIAAAGAGLSVGLGVALVIALQRPDTPPTVATPPAVAEAPTPPKVEPPKPPDPVPAEPKPPETKAPEPKVPEVPAWAFERWEQDAEAAKAQARDARKDVLLVFDSSDWSDFSKSLAEEVFAKPEHWKRLTERFVPVHLDFPHYPAAQRRVKDAARNRAAEARFFQNPGYPRVVLADGDGRPYAVRIGYPVGRPEAYLAELEKFARTRAERDDVLSAVEAAAGAAKLPAITTALEYLTLRVETASPWRGDGRRTIELDEFYASLLTAWAKLAAEHDPANAAGHREKVVWHDWGRRAERAVFAGNTGAMPALVKELDDFRAGSTWKDPEFAAGLLAQQAVLLDRLGDTAGKHRTAREGLALRPSPRWQRALAPLAGLGGGSGSGFAVAAGGFVATNHHVVAGKGRVTVRVPGQKAALDAQVVARDEKVDLAVLKVALPPSVKLPPLPVVLAAAGRGTDVATLGFPLGDPIATLTRGVISQRVEEAGRPTVLTLDVRINPGNSGGPLFDTAGNVVGVVTAKSAAGGRLDSYGFAVGADALDKFLAAKKVAGYKPATALVRKLDWAAVDKQVAPSVVQVFQAAE